MRVIIYIDIQLKWFIFLLVCLPLFLKVSNEIDLEYRKILVRCERSCLLRVVLIPLSSYYLGAKIHVAKLILFAVGVAFVLLGFFVLVTVWR